MVTIFSSGVPLAPSAHAAPSASLRNAVASARATSCAPMQYNPIVEQVAEVSNRTSDNWLNKVGTHYPVTDPKSGLKDLGYGNDLNNIKGQLLNGAANTEDGAIHGVILEYVYDKFDDCSFTDFGVSMIHDEQAGFYLSSVVVAGHY
ncbi:hypothetical protein BST14_18965 [Mycobacterium arosiense ATCC BAA-1401 = DSM 45069]|uniref:SCP domain-containing protein n=1 Tax=Mycobacterium arosiense ATCC BAA-1401 = DSM 45069 TaxID=1265311 RepID=A0A1W9ZBJ8_MYCAI|nr:hypothetical protein BST14_18965 [Mycobacterium arosiense ATCC BAA-1401 = DSM 45069]